MTALGPTVTGAVTTYSVSPALPAGLVIDSATGVISGAPSPPAAGATYNVTAANSAGATPAGVSITVNQAALAIGYDAAAYTFATGVPVNLAPINTGGAVTQWSINQALPAGLTFSSSDGVITGTPTAASAASDYVITAQNDSGSDTHATHVIFASGAMVRAEPY